MAHLTNATKSMDIIDTSLLSSLEFVASETRLQDLTLDDINAQIKEHANEIKNLNSKKEIVEHRRAIAFYKGRRNAITSPIIVTLPPELLAEVFLNYAQYCFPNIDEERTHCPYQWLQATHVCRYWRHVAVSFPRIFSDIDLAAGKEEHLCEWLRHSREFPLTVIVNGEIGCYRALSRKWQLLAPHLPHTRSLHLPFNPPQDIPWPRSPLLTTLVWTAPSPERTFIEKVFCALPNLQVLESTTVTLGPNWAHLPLPASLKTLTIKHSKQSTCLATIPMEELFEGLSTLQDLETLKLIDIKRVEYPLCPDTSAPVFRHPLKTLELTGHIKPCFSLLRNVKSVDHLTLKLLISIKHNHNVIPLAETLVPFLSRNRPRTCLCTADMSLRHSNTLIFTAWNTEMDLIAQGAYGPIYSNPSILHVRLSFYGVQTVRDTAKSFCETISPSLSGVDYLIVPVNGYQREGAPCWDVLKPVLQNVRLLDFVLKKASGLEFGSYLGAIADIAPLVLLNSTSTSNPDLSECNFNRPSSPRHSQLDPKATVCSEEEQCGSSSSVQDAGSKYPAFSRLSVIHVTGRKSDYRWASNFLRGLREVLQTRQSLGLTLDALELLLPSDKSNSNPSAEQDSDQAVLDALTGLVGDLSLARFPST
ncbi:unnamed protein product [Somion occarium]|uniref:F-box domain-containing protein n=1 Tax=Somion occarium TaxID=3059160 RepID=A0ABP1DZH0_9APHY